MRFFKEFCILITAYMAVPASSLYGGRNAEENSRREVCSFWRRSTNLLGIVDITVLPSYQCTAVVASSRTLVTAAHCIDDINNVDVGKYFVVCGGNTLEPLTGQQLSIENIITPDDYDGTVRSPSDIAMIILEAPLAEYGNSVIAAEFARNEWGPWPGDVYGWGATSDGIFGLFPVYPTQLQTARVIIRDDSTCRQLLGDNANDFQQMIMFCVTGPSEPTGQESNGICSGDGGAPLFVNDVVIGIATWRPGSCDGSNNYPSVFTNIAALYYNNFIRRIINENQ